LAIFDRRRGLRVPASGFRPPEPRITNDGPPHSFCPSGYGLRLTDTEVRLGAATIT